MNRKNINNYVNAVMQGSAERRWGGGPRRQNISLVPSDGAGLTGMCGGGDGPPRIFINISRVASAQRTASLPTNPRGPHVETGRENERGRHDR